MNCMDKRYLKGPIAWSWLTRAAELPGRSLHVAIALSFMAGVSRSDTVALPTQRLAEMGVDRFAAYRALNQLDSAGLVAAERLGPGRKTRVRLVGHEVVLTARRLRPGQSSGAAR